MLYKIFIFEDFLQLNDGSGVRVEDVCVFFIFFLGFVKDRVGRFFY